MIIKTHEIPLCIDNIKLRPMCDADFDILLKWNSDAEVLYYAGSEDVESYSLEEIEGIYGYVSKTAYCFIIEYDNMPIGECWIQKMNINSIIEKYPNLDLRRIDIVIGEKEYWGKGIGTKAVKLLTEFGFEKDKADMIFYIPDDFNVRSWRVAERLGYKLLDQVAIESSKAKLELHYGITKEDYFLLASKR